MYRSNRSSRLILLVISAVIVTGLTGCLGPTTFVHPTGSPQTFEVDKQQCLYEAKLHQPQNPENWPDTVRTCLYTKGWKPAPKQAAVKQWPMQGET